MADDAIQVFNRYTGGLETEDVYGHAFLRWTYGNPLGRLSLHGLVKRAIFSRWYGQRMDAPGSRNKILPFIENYGVKAEEFADAPHSFKSFNEFFYRKLKPGARPVDPDTAVAVFPADGRHLGFQDISKAAGIFVKGEVFDVRALIADHALAERYRHATVVLSRLCPVDYHRFHFPVAGVATAPKFIDGPLFSVNPIALRRNIHILARNKRAFCEIVSPGFGRVLMFEVGATCVGSFEYTYMAGVVGKGAEKGYFKFGGSSTITLFEPHRVQLDADLLEQTARGIELYARIGDHMARRTG